MKGRARRADERGFTLIELVVVMSLASVLASIGAFGFWNWRKTAQQQGSAQQLVSVLRNSSERAVSEGRTYCVDLDAGGGSYTLWRTACVAGTGSQVAGPYATQSTKVTITAEQTQPPSVCPASHKCMYFLPRGTGTATVLTVSSSARSRTYTVHVEGLTARVWM